MLRIVEDVYNILDQYVDPELMYIVTEWQLIVPYLLNIYTVILGAINET